jgi:hypothetical protein
MKDLSAAFAKLAGTTPTTGTTGTTPTTGTPTS